MALKKFRKQAVIVQAEQWFPGEQVEGVKLGFAVEIYDTSGEEPFCETLNGLIPIEPGEWIITGAAGEKYPCKKEIFELTYEPVDEALLRQEADAGVEGLRVASAAEQLDRVREVIRELAEGNPVVGPERVAEWLMIFLATSRDYDRERGERIRQLTVELAEARRYMPQKPLEVVQVSVVDVVDNSGKFSEHDDG